MTSGPMRTGMVDLYVLRDPYALGVTSAESVIWSYDRQVVQTCVSWIASLGLGAEFLPERAKGGRTIKTRS